jgi:hypothetical protein
MFVMCWIKVWVFKASSFCGNASVELDEWEDAFEIEALVNSGVSGTIGDAVIGEDDEKLGILLEESFADDLEVSVSVGIESESVALLTSVGGSGLEREGCR